jgi:2-dehydropantoate 2-reductase
MRFIVYGAGAIGGLAGGLMAEAGEDVVLIARGAHAAAIAARGLTIESAERTRTVAVPVVTDPDDLRVGEGDAVLLAMKSQDTGSALHALGRTAPCSTPIACLQNGVENERIALRSFTRVYGVCVMCPATHLEPGVVQQNSVPIPGMLDIGPYPARSPAADTDTTMEQIAAGFRAGGFESIERPDIMRWKYRKLLLNLGNAASAVITGDGLGDISRRARAEGEACFTAAGIDHASQAEDTERRGDILKIREIAGRPYRGGSSWQSLQRGAGSIESDYLNGEVSLLGRMHGVATPVNDLLGELAFQAAVRQDPPGQLTVEQFEARLAAQAKAIPSPAPSPRPAPTA